MIVDARRVGVGVEIDMTALDRPVEGDLRVLRHHGLDLGALAGRERALCDVGSLDGARRRRRRFFPGPFRDGEHGGGGWVRGDRTRVVEGRGWDVGVISGGGPYCN